MTRLFPLLLLLAGLLSIIAPGAMAQPVTIYRCTDTAGQLTVQNQPCPAGATQHAQTIQGVPSAPLPAPSAAAPFPSAPEPAPAIPAADHPPHPDAAAAPRILDSAALPRPIVAPSPIADTDTLPPPPLFTCHTHDGDSYLAEDPEQPPRCVALDTTGLDGGAGAGQACEVVHDRCVRVPDGAACDAWRHYARQAESRWRFAHPDNVQRRHDEYQRLARIVAATGCGD